MAPALGLTNCLGGLVEFKDINYDNWHTIIKDIVKARGEHPPVREMCRPGAGMNAF